MNHSPPDQPVAPRLGLWDAVSIIVGIVVGTAIFKTTAMVFQNTAGPWLALGAWLLGGVISLCGAFCYAELATAYPRDGGDYEYLTRAFGRWLGFLFAWAQLAVVISGSIGIMAYAFADYAARIWTTWGENLAPLAILPVVVLSLTNGLGAVAGKTTQNLLTAAKVLGLAAVVMAGFWAGVAGVDENGVGSLLRLETVTIGASDQSPKTPDAFLAPAEEESRPLPQTGASSPGTLAGFGLAMVFVLYAYGGWNHAAFVAAEVRDQRRNLPRALLIGIAGITAIYLAVNVAYLAALGFEGAGESPTPAADVLEQVLGTWGATAISVLVMISALAAINGMIFTGSRVFAIWGADYPRLGWLAGWNRPAAAPTAAIAAQGAVAVLFILVVGTARGQRWFDAVLESVGLGGLPWETYFGGFETLVAGTAPVFWAFFLLTGIAVFVLRYQRKKGTGPFSRWSAASSSDREQNWSFPVFSIPLFPLPPLVFCATCAFMLWASLDYAGWLTLLGVVPLILGVPVLLAVRRG